MRRIPLLAGLLAALACGDDDASGGSTEAPPPAAPDVRLMALTDLEGTLEPCGCTSRPLGGLDRMVARTAALATEAPSTLLAVGNLFFDLAHGGDAQEVTSTWQAEAVVDILEQAGLAAATPGPRDLAHGLAAFEALRARADFPFLAANWRLEDAERPLPASRVLDLGGHRIGVVGVSALPPGAPIAADDPLDAARRALEDLPEDARVRVVLVQGDRRLARRVAALEGVDFVIVGGLDQADAIPPARSGDGWVVYGGRQGQGVLVLDLHLRGAGPFEDASEWSREVAGQRLDAEIADLEERVEAWEAGGANPEDVARQRRRLEQLRRLRAGLSQPAAPQGNSFEARWVPIDPDSPRDPEVKRRLDELARRVNDHNRRALADRRPPPVPEGQPSYVGSAACAGCHAAAYTWWQSHPHGRAYATLQERHREYHLECVGCHVTGYEQPGGSTVTHNLDGALMNVGCEVCHGPGSAHVQDPSPQNIRRDPGEQVCVRCHNEEHSDLFSYEGYRATLLVPGHGRPLPTP